MHNTETFSGDAIFFRSAAFSPEMRRRRYYVLNVRAHISTLMILPQVHLRKPCYDFYFL